MNNISDVKMIHFVSVPEAEEPAFPAQVKVELWFEERNCDGGDVKIS